jgi:CheY-like chemotaxis protein
VNESVIAKRILIVDDAATVRMYHRGILESAGYAVEEAMNGIEALEKLLKFHSICMSWMSTCPS